MPEINRCPDPECGGVAHVYGHHEARASFFRVECYDCDLSGPSRTWQEEAIAAWNRLTMRPEAEPGPAGDFGEPWDDGEHTWDAEIRDRDGDPVLDIGGSGIGRGSLVRATSCVNALAGLNPEALGEFIQAAEQIEEVINDSHGVDGWHLNGDIASWGEVGGDEFLAALAKLRGEAKA